VVERDLRWSPEENPSPISQTIPANTRCTSATRAASAKSVKIDLAIRQLFYYSPTWSPDSKKIATPTNADFCRGPGEEKRPFAGVQTRTPTGSSAPNGLVTGQPWIAYTKQLETT